MKIIVYQKSNSEKIRFHVNDKATANAVIDLAKSEMIKNKILEGLGVKYEGLIFEIEEKEISPKKVIKIVKKLIDNDFEKGKKGKKDKDKKKNKKDKKKGKKDKKKHKHDNDDVEDGCYMIESRKR